MQVNTKKVKGRRQVHYDSLSELLADAERLAQVDVQTLGNWTPGQIYQHLAQSLDGSIDGLGFSLPAPVRVLMSLFMKRKFLKEAIPAGFKSTKEFIPPATSTESGLASLRAAVERQDREPSRAIHPAFGKIGRDGWNDFHLRHAEMHMSFLISEAN